MMTSAEIPSHIMPLVTLVIARRPLRSCKYRIVVDELSTAILSTHGVDSRFVDGWLDRTETATTMKKRIRLSPTTRTLVEAVRGTPANVSQTVSFNRQINTFFFPEETTRFRQRQSKISLANEHDRNRRTGRENHRIAALAAIYSNNQDKENRAPGTTQKENQVCPVRAPELPSTARQPVPSTARQSQSSTARKNLQSSFRHQTTPHRNAASVVKIYVHQHLVSFYIAYTYFGG